MDDVNKIRYSDEELEEFRILIADKIEKLKSNSIFTRFRSMN